LYEHKEVALKGY